MAESLHELRQRICLTYEAGFEPPAPGSKVGIALQTLGRVPVHGVRLPPTETTCGWYIYAGDEWSDDPNFYLPLCVEHMAEYCKFALPFFCLPPGWRFMTDGQGSIDVWQEAEPAAAPNPRLKVGGSK
ncbi:MAG: hypothetical protein JO280_08670 [Mycobacteriaceae bacterium]|nr:hypothetical protein [Mycobacteriaceae bacterium]